MKNMDNSKEYRHLEQSVTGEETKSLQKHRKICRSEGNDRTDLLQGEQNFLRWRLGLHFQQFIFRERSEPLPRSEPWQPTNVYNVASNQRTQQPFGNSNAWTNTGLIRSTIALWRLLSVDSTEPKLSPTDATGAPTNPNPKTVWCRDYLEWPTLWPTKSNCETFRGRQVLSVKANNVQPKHSCNNATNAGDQRSWPRRRGKTSFQGGAGSVNPGQFQVERINRYNFHTIQEKSLKTLRSYP